MTENKKNNKVIVIGCKVKTEDKARIEKYAEKLYISVSDFIRQAIWEKIKRMDNGNSSNNDGVLTTLDFIIKNQQTLSRKFDKLNEITVDIRKGIPFVRGLEKFLARDRDAKDFQNEIRQVISVLKIKPLKPIKIADGTGLSNVDVQTVINILKRDERIEYDQHGRVVLKK